MIMLQATYDKHVSHPDSCVQGARSAPVVAGALENSYRVAMAAGSFVVGGYYGYGNLGDEALRMALADALEHTGAFAVWLTAHPRATDEIGRMRPLRVYRALRRADGLLLGGGGLLQNRTSNRSLAYYLGLIALGRIARRPVFLLGQGIGPITGRSMRAIARAILARAAYVGCRDEDSVHLASTLGARASLDGDLFFLFPPLPQAPSPQEDGKHRIALSLNGLRGDKMLLETVVEALAELSVKEALSVVLLPFFPSQDMTFAERLAARLSERVATQHAELDPRISCRIAQADTVEQAMSEIAQADLVVSSRLHPLEFALRAGTPMIAIHDDAKAANFVGEVERNDGPRIPCVDFPTSSLVNEMLATPPEASAMQEAYARMHRQAHAALARVAGLWRSA